MNLLNPIFAILLYLIAFATAYLLQRKYKIVNNTERFQTIDGLRGLLAIGVYISHTVIWYQYLHTNVWTVTESNLYTHLGQTSVSFFFMITSFLFISKLLNSNNQKIDWTKFYIHRFFRLSPMYLVSLCLIVVIIFTIDDWELKSSPRTFLIDMARWLAFTYPGSPNINESELTLIINAGVVWSLPYEWLFYFSLPILSLIINRKKTPYFYLITSLILIILYYKSMGFIMHHMLSFLGGAIAPFVIKFGPKNINFNSVVFSIIIIVCLLSILFFNNAYYYSCKVLIIIVFNLVALGNTVFGSLKLNILKFLGEISYSTYLIHGIVLFLVFYWGFGLEMAATLTSTQFGIVIALLTPLVVVISFLTYLTIEKPCMDYSKRVDVEVIIQRFKKVWK